MPLIRFTRGVGRAGWVVRTFTWSDFSHVGFKLDDGRILDSTPELGVSFRVDCDDDTTEYYAVCAPSQVIARAVAWAEAQVGKPYDWSAIWGFVCRRDSWQCDDRWFCSELVEKSFDNAGFPILRDRGQVDRITPRDLLLSTRLARVSPPKL